MKRLKEMKKNNKGFSLVELIVVIAIMVVLIAVLGSAILGYVEKSKYSKDISALDSLNSAIKAYAVDPNANYKSGDPYTLKDLIEGVDAKNNKPRDPYNEIKNILKETFPDGKNFANSSDAFKGLTTEKISVMIKDGAVSIFVPSESNDYAPYGVGEYKNGVPANTP